MKKIVGDILKNKNINDNLQEYYGKFMEINNKYAMIRLAMNYYTYYTMTAEDDVILQAENMAGMNLINKAIENMMNGNEESLQADITAIESLREGIIEKVQDLTCYVDRFNIYEYALNRVEYRFKDEDYPAGYSDENLTRQLMQFILEDEDNMAINQKISQVIGQLPIRLTKNKFYEMLSNGFSIYKGGTKESFKDFLYMIRTTSMLETTATMQENYPYLEESLRDFSKVNFKEMSAEQYEDMSNDVVKVSDYITELMDCNMVLQGLVNDLLVILYTKEHKVEDGVVKACEEIIKDTNLLFMGKFSPKSMEEIEDMFIVLEGTQEELYPQISTYDVTAQIAESYTENIEELGLAKEYEVVFKLPKLNSDSIFVEMNKAEDNSEADEAFIESEKEKLFEEYSQLFAGTDRMVKRAVMSAAIAELPVFFNNISELQDFIYNTLSTCTDKAEKLACIEILNGIMEE